MVIVITFLLSCVIMLFLVLFYQLFEIEYVLYILRKNDVKKINYYIKKWNLD